MPKLSDWFLEAPPSGAFYTPSPPAPELPRKSKKARPPKPVHDDFEVICDTALGPLPRLTPRAVDKRWNAFHTGVPTKEGAPGDLSWTHGQIPARTRRGYIEPEWRD